MIVAPKAADRALMVPSRNIHIEMLLLMRSIAQPGYLDRVHWQMKHAGLTLWVLEPGS